MRKLLTRLAVAVSAFVLFTAGTAMPAYAVGHIFGSCPNYYVCVLTDRGAIEAWNYGVAENQWMPVNIHEVTRMRNRNATSKRIFVGRQLIGGRYESDGLVYDSRTWVWIPEYFIGLDHVRVGTTAGCQGVSWI